MKNTYTQEELDQIAHGAYKAYGQACQDIKENVTDELDIIDEDYEDDDREELIENLNAYIFPWNPYETRQEALYWLKLNEYITE